MNNRRRKPSRNQPLLPLRDTTQPGSDLDREVQAFAAEARREPLPGQAELPMTAGEADVLDRLRVAMEASRALRDYVLEVEPEPEPEPEPARPDPDDELTATEWAERHLAGSMTGEDDEPWSEDDLAWMREHPTDYERTP